MRKLVLLLASANTFAKKKNLKRDLITVCDSNHLKNNFSISIGSGSNLFESFHNTNQGNESLTNILKGLRP